MYHDGVFLFGVVLLEKHSGDNNNRNPIETSFFHLQFKQTNTRTLFIVNTIYIYFYRSKICTLIQKNV